MRPSLWTSTRRLARLLPIALLLAAAGCDDDDPSGPNGSNGQLTVWTSDPSPSPIAVQLNGTAIGTLTAFFNSAPACGTATSNGVITVTRPAGTYSLRANETEDTGVWGPVNVTIPAGGCVTFHLQP